MSPNSLGTWVGSRPTRPVLRPLNCATPAPLLCLHHAVPKALAASPWPSPVTATDRRDWRAAGKNFSPALLRRHGAMRQGDREPLYHHRRTPRHSACSLRSRLLCDIIAGKMLEPSSSSLMLCVAFVEAVFGRLGARGRRILVGGAGAGRGLPRPTAFVGVEDEPGRFDLC
jgi:hypothetical protein